MSINDPTTAALVNLSLTNNPATPPAATQATKALRSLCNDIADLISQPELRTDGIPLADQRQYLFQHLMAYLMRRQTIFTNYKQILTGKGTKYAGLAATEAELVWQEAEQDLGWTLRISVENEVFDEEQIKKLRELTEPHFDWSGV